MKLLKHNIRVHLVALLLFVFPAISAAPDAPAVLINTDINMINNLNYIGLVIALLLFMLKRGRFNILALQITLLFICLLVINLLMTEYASVKWAFNWIGFLFIFFVLITVFANIKFHELEKLEVISFKYIILSAIILGSASLFIYSYHYSEFINRIMSVQLNNVIALLSYNLGVEKQSLGNLGALLIVFFVIAHNSMSLVTTIIFSFCLIALAPAFVGVRTLILGLLAGCFTYFILRTQLRILFSILFLGLPSALYVSINWAIFTEAVAQLYDRWASITFAFNYMVENLFGLGNGGYHIYVDRYNDLLLTTFGSELMMRSGTFWLAPESDIAYFIASWGILSFVFF